MNVGVLNDFEKKILESNFVVPIVTKTFPLLNKSDTDFLIDKLKNVLFIIHRIYFSKDINSYYLILKENNYLNVKAMLNILLPYINDDNGSKKKEIVHLDEIATRMVKDVNPELDEPKYYYSNFNYGIYIKPSQKTKFNRTMIEHNYLCLTNTLLETSYKLMPNWTNIIPISYLFDDIFSEKDDYFNISKFISNKDEFKIEDTSSYDTFIQTTNKISMKDLYECIYHDFYDSIKRFKWLIYDLKNNSNGFYPAIYYLDFFLIDDNINNNIRWANLTDDDRYKFIDKWNNIVGLYFTSNAPLKLNNFTFKSIIKSIVIFFANYHKNMFNLKINIDDVEFKSPFDLNNEESNEDIEDLPDEDDDNNLDVNIDESLKTLNPLMVYEFMRITIDKFKQTYYGIKYSLNKDKPIFLRQFDQRGNLWSVTFKNLFNFSKSLITKKFLSDETEKHIIFGKYWCELTNENKKIIIERLNERSDPNKLLSWFNITRNIKRTLVHQLNKNIDLVMTNSIIFESIINSIEKICIESLSIRGVLTKLVANPSLTDETYPIGDSVYYSDTMKSTTFSVKSKFKNCFHFLTKKRYDEMGPYKLNGVDVDFYDYVASQDWTSMYAMNWVSQISFFHRFINNRMIMVTGSTGVGKSTQIPKLLLYGLSSILHKNQGIVVCTEPRIPPTWKNAVRVADELGVPIEEHNEVYYHVQYKFSQSSNNEFVDNTRANSHIQENISGLVLRFVTDGTLLKEIKNPYLLKVKKNDSVKQDFKFENLYDVVIIDESHEHNPNMDMILTLIKTPMNINISVSLVTISATMDEDEPVYRRYYKIINDNLKYPINTMLKEKKIDRIAIDRRIHISPPDKTTRFIIDEHYQPNSKAEDIVLNILKTTSTGDILLFQPGLKEITQSIQIINKSSPSNVIAVPYYSELDTVAKGIVENIDKKGHLIQISKDKIFGNPDSLNSKEVPINTYNRFVIVATNIAEASITITTLKFVVDTGKQKIGVYDYNRGTVNLISTDISESSRLQRKGRVGRKSSGSVYYTYKKGAMENNKTEFKITNSDITQQLFSTLTSETEIINYYEIIYRKLNTTETISTYSIIHNNYYNIDRTDTLYNYVGVFSEELNQTEDILKFNYYYYYVNMGFDGRYDKNTIIDMNGLFYIIHPEENVLRRNIKGEIISHNMTGKINLILNFMTNKLLIDGVLKSKLGLLIDNFYEKLEIEDFSKILTLLFAYTLNVHDYLIPSLGVLSATNGKLQHLYNTYDFKHNGVVKKYSQANKVRGIFIDNTSDLNAIYNIFHTIIKRYNLEPNIPYELKKNGVNIKKIEEELINNDKLQTYKSIGIPSNEDLNELIDKNIFYYILKDYIDNDNKYLEGYSKVNYLNHATLIKSLHNIIKLYNYLHKNKIVINEIKTFILNSSKFSYIYNLNYNKPLNLIFNRDDLIAMSVIYGYHQNVLLNIHSKPYYISIFNIKNLDSSQILSLVSFDREGKNPENLVKKYRLITNIIFLSYDSNIKAISFVSRIELHKLIKFIISIYGLSEFNYDTALLKQNIMKNYTLNKLDVNNAIYNKLIDFRDIVRVNV
jgi:hypothetical protein